MALPDLLNALQKVKKTGPSRYIALCPAHPDKRPSLTITEKDDGMVLIKCWAGCGAADILGAIGLDFDALYPPRLDDHRGKPARKPWNPYDLLKVNAFEADIVALAAMRISNGHALGDDEKQRLMMAHHRLRKASELVNG